MRKEKHSNRDVNIYVEHCITCFLFILTVSLFKLFEPLIGEKSIQYANKEDGKNRRKQYNTVFNQNYLHHYYAGIQEVRDLVYFS